MVKHNPRYQHLPFAQASLALYYGARSFVDALILVDVGLGVFSPYKAARLGGEVAGEAEEVVTIYRGVNSNAGKAYENALEGVVKPRGGAAGHSDPLRHNTAPDGTVDSKLTSWTTDPEVALNYAYRGSGEGVVLEMSVPKSSLITSPNLKRVNLIQDPGRIVSESEVLLKGVQNTPIIRKVQLPR